MLPTHFTKGNWGYVQPSLPILQKSGSGPPGGEPVPTLGILKHADLQAGPVLGGQRPPAERWPWGVIYLGAFLPAAGSHTHILGPLGNNSELRDNWECPWPSADVEAGFQR